LIRCAASAFDYFNQSINQPTNQLTDWRMQMAEDDEDSQGVMAVALYDYEAQEGSQQLSFKTGDTLQILTEEVEGWVMASLAGATGQVPLNYMKLKNDPAADQRRERRKKMVEERNALKAEVTELCAQRMELEKEVARLEETKGTAGGVVQRLESLPQSQTQFLFLLRRLSLATEALCQMHATSVDANISLAEELRGYQTAFAKEVKGNPALEPLKQKYDEKIEGLISALISPDRQPSLRSEFFVSADAARLAVQRASK
jgi:hypothetical protein